MTFRLLERLHEDSLRCRGYVVLDGACERRFGLPRAETEHALSNSTTESHSVRVT